MTTLEETIAAQRTASDPGKSAFVAANAGAGKTSVLTNRVARLLLSGVAPERILCITFTKAAAAEMASRLFDMLGRWSLLDDGPLGEALDAIDGGCRQRDFRTARRLFARALDTPGGLKIQTIHAFCDQVLRRFPLEAGVAPGYSVLTETEAKALVEAAFDQVALADQGALVRLVSDRGADAVRKLVVELVGGRRRKGRARTPESFRTAIAGRIGVHASVGEAEARLRCLDVVSVNDMRRAQSAFRKGLKTAAATAEDAMATFLSNAQAETRLAALTSVLLTQKGEVRSRYGDEKARATDASVEPFLRDRANALVAAIDLVKRIRMRDDTLALLAIVDATLARYGVKKSARAALDFDDLIHNTRALLEREDAAWVRYKLDSGVDHILLDEAQDTSPEQWRILEALIAEMVSGDGVRAKTTARSFFAVGDQKQSIYAFQGADAGLFDAKRHDLGQKLAAVCDFVQPHLALSFRSTSAVLDFVDEAFNDDGARAGLVAADGVVEHAVKRTGERGRVELWPLAPRDESPAPDPWDRPLDMMTANDPVRLLTSAIADRIARWSRDGIDAAPFAPGDALILVQTRGPLFHEMIKALSRRGVPVAGADRIELLKDPAVEDLLAFARAALFEGDDLALAETLKGSFFGFDDDALFALAYGRKGRLIDALRLADDPCARRAATEIDAARRIGLDHGAFRFFDHILETGTPSGRRRLQARLGAAWRDAVEELVRQALAHEGARPRSLRGFVDDFMASAGDVKREMSERGPAVRVMTVHGAKGLQAPVVFLLDAHNLPKGQTAGVFPLPRDAAGAAEPLIVLSRRKEDDPDMLLAARARASELEYQEYRRRFYVASTRAEDRLIICGLTPGKGDPSAESADRASWYELSLRTMRRLGAATTPFDAYDGDVLFFENAGEPPKREPPKMESSADAVEFSDQPVCVAETQRRIQPSRLASDAEDDGAAASPSDGRVRGRVIHKLLERLPDAPLDRRRDIAEAIAARVAQEAPEAQRRLWIDETLAVLDHADFRAVFLPHARAEAAVVGRIVHRDGSAVVNGLIDRLLVEEGRVLIVDYKTNRPPPDRAENAPRSYVAQLAAYRALLQQIYPASEVSCALLWTFTPRLMPIPAPLLDHALMSAFDSALDP